MLTHYQVDLFRQISLAAKSFLPVGTICAAAVSAGIRLSYGNRCNAKGVLQDVALSSWIGTLSSAALSISLAAIDVTVFSRGWKGEREVPAWYATSQIILLLVVAATMALFCQRYSERLRSFSIRKRALTVLVSTLAGSILGAIVFFGYGLDAYFLAPNNAEAIEHAYLGAWLGGIAGLLAAFIGAIRRGSTEDIAHSHANITLK